MLPVKIFLRLAVGKRIVGEANNRIQLAGKSWSSESQTLALYEPPEEFVKLQLSWYHTQGFWFNGWY